MPDQINRRTFLRQGLAGLSLFAAGGLLRYQQAFAANSPTATFSSLANIGELLPPDANGLMLPPGFKSRVVARSGEAPTGLPGYTWHPAPDGGACFPAPDNGWIYVSNSEMRSNAGGVGALRFASNGDVVDAYSILANTTLNCAGGATPWGTWLSCEEFDLGQVYECDPFGKMPAKIRPALGTFKHEAVAVDALNAYLYLTEDQPDGGFYRFKPAQPLPYLDSGQLDIASVVERDGNSYIQWIPVSDPLARRTPTRHQNELATPFRGGEGIVVFGTLVYFSTKRDNRVWCYHTDTDRLDVVYDFATNANPVLSGVDNLAITTGGDVVVAEDGGNMQLVVLTPDDKVLPLLQVVDQDRSELTGPAFDPTFQRLYVSSQRGVTGRSENGMTFEISHA